MEELPLVFLSTNIQCEHFGGGGASDPLAGKIWSSPAMSQCPGTTGNVDQTSSLQVLGQRENNRSAAWYSYCICRKGSLTAKATVRLLPEAATEPTSQRSQTEPSHDSMRIGCFFESAFFEAQTCCQTLLNDWRLWHQKRISSIKNKLVEHHPTKRQLANIAPKGDVCTQRLSETNHQDFQFGAFNTRGSPRWLGRGWFSLTISAVKTVYKGPDVQAL